MKAVAVYSTKGGVGKTTAAVNLAWEASRTQRVLLWDLDPQGAATFLLNVKPKLKGGVDSLVTGDTDALQAVRETAYERLDVLPADKTYRDLDLVFDAAKKSTHRIAKVLQSVARHYDVVILDCPPGASLVAENALYAADAIVVPLVPSPLSIRSLEQVRQIVSDAQRSAPIVAFLSMVDRRRTAHRAAIEQLSEHNAELVDVVVPYTVVVERMGSERAPIGLYAPAAEAALAYGLLWESLRASLKLKKSGKSQPR